MAERNFIVLRYAGRVPAMAACEKCKRKFFTPAAYHEAAGAYEYLFSKFDHHFCEETAVKPLLAWSFKARGGRHLSRKE